MQFLKKNKVFFLFRANLSHFVFNTLNLTEKITLLNPIQQEKSCLCDYINTFQEPLLYIYQAILTLQHEIQLVSHVF